MRRLFVTASKPDAILINVGSLQGRPRISKPMGRLSEVNPLGTMNAGRPVMGLSWFGVYLRSGSPAGPISASGEME
jgi:hypothetical protein